MATDPVAFCKSTHSGKGHKGLMPFARICEHGCVQVDTIHALLECKGIDASARLYPPPSAPLS